MKLTLSAVVALSSAAFLLAQAPAGGRAGGGRAGFAPRPALSVSSPAWQDGDEIPLTNSFYGDNKSPAFEFHWTLGANPTMPPDTLKTYAVIFHDIENSTNKTAVDTLHWSAFNIPGTATGLPAGLAAGTLPDGTVNGPGIAMGRPNATEGSYFGPGAGPGPFHHYVFEFYALDTKLDLPAKTTREDLMKAMDGHIIGKAAYVGRFHGPAGGGRGR
jgi:Raf kinase inhibitor-like YbhB/YbcL family protein